MKLSRKHLIQSTGAAGAGILLAGYLDRATVQAQPQTLPRRLPMYVDPLPTAIPLLTPDTTTYPDADYYEITMRPGSWKFHSRLPKAALTWGYWGRDAVTGKSASLGLGYLGPTIQAQSGRPVVVKYVNKLTGRHPVQDSIDFTIAGNTPRASYPIGRAVPHLHGGFTPSQFDGGPHAWWDAHGAHDPMRGYYSLPGQARNEAIYWYSNRQPATLLWYHDHAMGITRLNVYAGLAGFYIVRDQHDTGTPANPLGLPAGAFEIPLALQDKRFTVDGRWTIRRPTTSPIPIIPIPNG
jgi:spore coat protein A